MRYLFFVLALLFGPSLEARDITFYTKKALHKTGSFWGRREKHNMSGIDFIYVINAKKDIDRFRSLKKSFAKYHICPYRFNCVDPAKLNYKTLFNIGYNTKRGLYDEMQTMVARSGKNVILEEALMIEPKTTFFHRQFTLKGIARNIDFLSVIFDAYKSKYKAVWIMTDTAKILVDPNILTGNLIKLKAVHPDWDVLYTDVDSRDHRPMIFEDLEQPLRPDVRFDRGEVYRARETKMVPISNLGLRSGAYSFILSRKAIKTIVQYYKDNQFFIPFELELQIIPDMNRYILRDEVVTNNPSN